MTEKTQFWGSYSAMTSQSIHLQLCGHWCLVFFGLGISTSSTQTDVQCSAGLKIPIHAHFLPQAILTC